MEIFSHEEIDFLKQAGFFAWKERLTSRLQGELTALHEALVPHVVPGALIAPDEMDWTRWQLVRGERFHDRPYVYLDCPQYFSRETKFTYRSMFWWGEGVFFALILEGALLDRYVENIERRYEAIADRDVSLSLADTPWEWSRSGRSVLPIHADTRDAVMAAARKRSFLKLQRVVALDRLIEPHAIVREGAATFEALRPVIAKTLPIPPFSKGGQGGI
ncbi:MAG: hypothetical protein ACOYXU_05105 [Nitrospirota bacterium]